MCLNEKSGLTGDVQAKACQLLFQNRRETHASEKVTNKHTKRIWLCYWRNTNLEIGSSTVLMERNFMDTRVGGFERCRQDFFFFNLFIVI